MATEDYMSEWISVKDKLPGKHERILCYDGAYMDVMEYWYEENGLPQFFNPPSPPKDFVTHWMPLPEPPRII